MTYQKNQELIVDIIDVNLFGNGIAKSEGVVLFVQRAVPGDRVRVRIIKCAKNYYVARIEEIITPSPFRKASDCPHFGRCGGCTLRHLNYDLEKKVKENYIRSCLKKENLNSVKVLPIFASPTTEHYRNKALYPIGLDKEGAVFTGFYSHHSHNICPISTCKIQPDVFSKIATFVCTYLQNHNILPYSQVTHTGLVRHLYLRSSATGKIMLCLVLKEDRFPEELHFADEVIKAFPQVCGIHFNTQPNTDNVILGDKTRLVRGTAHLRDTLCNRDFLLSPNSFYQVNHDAAQLLYQTAYNIANNIPFDLLVDLYCGVGTISLCAPGNTPILGIEIVPEAVRDAVQNAQLNGRENATFLCSDAKNALSLLSEHKAKRPLILLDPPRKGLSESLIHEIANTPECRDVLYISCAPDTLCRDLARFQSLGFQIGDLQPVDLFPRTGHVETVVLMSREKG